MQIDILFMQHRIFNDFTIEKQYYMCLYIENGAKELVFVHVLTHTDASV